MQKPSDDLRSPKWITIEDFEFICFNLARKLLELNEPIPDYSKTDIGLLESSLSSPRNAYEITGASLFEQSSILFYSLIKNHPFKNGNKRIAVMTLILFLDLNGKWLEMNPLLLVDIAQLVAESEPSNRDIIIQKNTEIFEKYAVD